MNNLELLERLGEMPQVDPKRIERALRGLSSSADQMGTANKKVVSSSTRRRLLLLAAAAVIAVSITLAFSLPQSGESEAAILAHLRHASTLVAKAPAFRVDISVRYMKTGRLVPVNATQSVEVQTRTGTQLSTFAQGVEVTTELVTTSTGYVRTTNKRNLPTSYPGWYSYPRSPLALTPHIPVGLSQFSFHSAAPPKSLGSKTVNGITMAGYRLKTSVQYLLQHARSEESRSYNQALVNSGILFYPTEVWLSHGGVVREFDWQIPKADRGPLSGSFAAALSFTELVSFPNRPPSFVPPPPKDVTATASRTDALEQSQTHVILFAKNGNGKRITLNFPGIVK